jgi:hypothetical protein
MGTREPVGSGSPNNHLGREVNVNIRPGNLSFKEVSHSKRLAHHLQDVCALDSPRG